MTLCQKLRIFICTSGINAFCAPNGVVVVDMLRHYAVFEYFRKRRFILNGHSASDDEQSNNEQGRGDDNSQRNETGHIARRRSHIQSCG